MGANDRQRRPRGSRTPHAFVVCVFCSGEGPGVSGFAKPALGFKLGVGPLPRLPPCAAPPALPSPPRADAPLHPAQPRHRAASPCQHRGAKCERGVGVSTQLFALPFPPAHTAHELTPRAPARLDRALKAMLSATDPVATLSVLSSLRRMKARARTPGRATPRRTSTLHAKRQRRAVGCGGVARARCCCARADLHSTPERGAAQRCPTTPVRKREAHAGSESVDFRSPPLAIAPRVASSGPAPLQHNLRRVGRQ